MLERLNCNYFGSLFYIYLVRLSQKQHWNRDGIQIFTNNFIQTVFEAKTPNAFC